MLARRHLPDTYREWNDHWGAPFGKRAAHSLTFEERLSDPDPARFGPFAFSLTSTTRVYEYPWAFRAARIKPGMRVLDVGGGLSGMQFVLAMEGCEVTTVDPSTDYAQTGAPPYPGLDWWLTTERHQAINRVFGTDVRLVNKELQNAGLKPASYDRVFCVSVLEHVDQRGARSVMEEVARLLVPGGRCVLSLALFLDLEPFGVLTRNHWGVNLDAYALVDGLGLALAEGDPSELFGFPEFDADHVVAQIPQLFVGYYPCLAELLVLDKTA